MMREDERFKGIKHFLDPWHVFRNMAKELWAVSRITRKVRG